MAWPSFVFSSVAAAVSLAGCAVYQENETAQIGDYSYRVTKSYWSDGAQPAGKDLQVPREKAAEAAVPSEKVSNEKTVPAKTAAKTCNVEISVTNSGQFESNVPMMWLQDPDGKEYTVVSIFGKEVGRQGKPDGELMLANRMPRLAPGESRRGLIVFDTSEGGRLKILKHRYVYPRSEIPFYGLFFIDDNSTYGYIELSPE